MRNTKEFPNAPVWLKISKAEGADPSEQTSMRVARIKVIIKRAPLII